MDIPIELFLGFISMTIALTVIGLVRQPKIPLIMIIAGGMIFPFVSITDNIIMDNRIDNVVATPETFNMTSSNVDIRVYPYSVVSNSANGEIDNSPTVRAEFVSATSTLIGDTFQCITIPMQLLGSPAGTLGVIVGFYDGSGLLMQQIGNTLSVGQLTASFQYFDFCLPDGTLHTFAENDRIGIGLNTTTTAGNGVNLRIDDTNPFDSTDTYRQSYVGTWASVTGGDMTFGMYREESFPINVQVAGIGGIYSYENNLFIFDEYPKIFFGIYGSLLMFLGAIVYWREP